MKYSFLLFFSIFITSCATGPNQFASAMNGKYGLDKYTHSNLSDLEIKTKTAFIYTLLANTSELRTHQFNGEIYNEVWLSKKPTESGGYAEGVFRFEHDENGNKIDGTGILVKACENMGSYNYKHPEIEPLGHFALDTLPWIELGNCRGDTTTKKQRVAAYVQDVELGLERIIQAKQPYVIPVNFKFNEIGQSETVAFFIKLLESRDFDLYSFIMNGQSIKEERIRFYSTLKQGLVDTIQVVRYNKCVNQTQKASLVCVFATLIITQTPATSWAGYTSVMRKDMELKTISFAILFLIFSSYSFAETICEIKGKQPWDKMEEKAFSKQSAMEQLKALNQLFSGEIEVAEEFIHQSNLVLEGAFYRMEVDKLKGDASLKLKGDASL